MFVFRFHNISFAGIIQTVVLIPVCCPPLLALHACVASRVGPPPCRNMLSDHRTKTKAFFQWAMTKAMGRDTCKDETRALTTEEAVKAVPAK